MRLIRSTRSVVAVRLNHPAKPTRLSYCSRSPEVWQVTNSHPIVGDFFVCGFRKLSLTKGVTSFDYFRILATILTRQPAWSRASIETAA